MSSQDQEGSVFKYIVLYGSVYLFAYTMITALSSIFRTYIFYAATSLVVAAFTATRFVKKNDRIMTQHEKIKVISGTFICTVLVNFFHTANVIGDYRSIDHLGGFFLVRQLINLFGLWLIFGSNYIYDSLKKQ